MAPKSENSIITPHLRLEGAKKSSQESDGHVKMAENVDYFNDTYGDFFSKINTSLGLDDTESRALISHESRFQHNAKNEKWSKGYMQLTGAPIRDIEARPQFFAPLYRKIQPQDIPDNAPKELKDLIAIFHEWPRAYSRIKTLIWGLLAKKDEPYTNLTIGSIYKAALWVKFEKYKTPEKIEAFVTKKLDILSSTGFFGLVARRVHDIIPGIPPSQMQEVFQSTRKNPDCQRQFLELRDYNGNTSAYGSNIEHRDIYAAVVLTVSELAKKYPVNKTRIA